MVNVTKRFAKTFLSNKMLRTKNPFFGSIEVTRKCNSRCAFCPIGHEKPELKQGEMSTLQAKTVLNQFGKVGILAVSFLGGEPFLRKDLFELTSYCTSLDMISQVSTNGILLEKTAEDATKNIDALVVSLDTVDRKKYRKLRGVDKFNNVVRGIEKSLELAPDNKCRVLVNTVICKENLEELIDVVKFSTELGVHGIMLDFATFRDYWKDLVLDGSGYKPDKMDPRQDIERMKKAVKGLIGVKGKYPILTSKSYLKTFLTNNFNFKCHPYLFTCVNKNGEVAVPCWDAQNTTFRSIVDGKNKLKNILASDEMKQKRKEVKNCSICYMHCIVEPSKVLGSTLTNIPDTLEWIRTFKKADEVIDF